MFIFLINCSWVDRGRALDNQRQKLQSCFFVPSRLLLNEASACTEANKVWKDCLLNYNTFWYKEVWQNCFIILHHHPMWLHHSARLLLTLWYQIEVTMADITTWQLSRRGSYISWRGTGNYLTWPLSWRGQSSRRGYYHDVDIITT